MLEIKKHLDPDCNVRNCINKLYAQGKTTNLMIRYLPSDNIDKSNVFFIKVDNNNLFPSNSLNSFPLVLDPHEDNYNEIMVYTKHKPAFLYWNHLEDASSDFSLQNLRILLKRG